MTWKPEKVKIQHISKSRSIVQTFEIKMISSASLVQFSLAVYTETVQKLNSLKNPKVTLRSRTN